VTKIAAVVTRMEHVPVVELSVPSDPKVAPVGFRVMFQLQSPDYPHNAALTFEVQMRSLPAVQVEELAPFLLGYLQGLLRGATEGEGPEKRAFDRGVAAARS
jgi:hypothetical protein